MDRFQEQTAAELVGNYYRRLYGDPYETFSALMSPSRLKTKATNPPSQ